MYEQQQNKSQKFLMQNSSLLSKSFYVNSPVNIHLCCTSFLLFPPAYLLFPWKPGSQFFYVFFICTLKTFSSNFTSSLHLQPSPLNNYSFKQRVLCVPTANRMSSSVLCKKRNKYFSIKCSQIFFYQVFCAKKKDIF